MIIYNYFILIQVKLFEGKGIKVAFVGKDQTDENIRSNVIAGEYSLVYMSPESMVTYLRYRVMFRSVVYQENFVGLAIMRPIVLRSGEWSNCFLTLVPPCLPLSFSFFSPLRPPTSLPLCIYPCLSLSLPLRYRLLYLQ